MKKIPLIDGTNALDVSFKIEIPIVSLSILSTKMSTSNMSNSASFVIESHAALSVVPR